jgi:hypothetical protein
MSALDWVLLITLGILGLVAFVSWRFDWRTSIYSRNWSVVCAMLAVLLVTPISKALLVFTLMSQADAHLGGREPSSAWWALYAGAVPVALALAGAVLASARRNRPWAFGAGLLTLVVGYAAIFAFTSLDQRWNMVTPVTYENRTGRPIEVWHQKDGDPGLDRDYPALVGTYVDRVGFRLKGDWIRIVAKWQDGTTLLDRTYTWDELGVEAGNVVVTAPNQ